MKESVRVLHECIDLQLKKSDDYQNEASAVKQADYYPRGVETIHDIMHGKMLRMVSLMEKSKAGRTPNFEGLEDSAKDLINYASFFVAYVRQAVDGQDGTRDMFNRPINQDPLIKTAEVVMEDFYIIKRDGGLARTSFEMPEEKNEDEQ